MASELTGQGIEVVQTGASTLAEYEQIFSSLKAKKLSHIIYLKNHGHAPVVDLPGLERNLDDGVRTFHAILKAMSVVQMDDPLTVAIVLDYASEVTKAEPLIKPENASLLGLGKVVNKEFAHITCMAIDIDDAVDATTILSEVKTSAQSYHRAYRAGKRYIERFQMVNLAEKAEQPYQFDSDGVYLITGGTGGIGLAIAEDLSQRAKVHLALLSRSGKPTRPERLEVIARIERNGATIEYPLGDSSDAARMPEIIAELRQKYGRIRGIVHSAGVPGKQFLVNQSLEEFTAVTNPKIQGTFLLDQLTEADKPDFMILCSSVATHFPALSQGDYTAANNYLDVFAQWRRRKGLKTVAVNWVAWKEIGMAFDTQSNIDAIFKALTTEKAVAALGELWGRDITNVLIGEVNFMDSVVLLMEKYPIELSDDIQERLNKKRGIHAPKKNDAQLKKGDNVLLGGRDNKEYSPTEQGVAALWGEVLGFKELDVYANFYELGGDSVLALQIVNGINKKYAIKLKLSDVLHHQNIATLSAVLDKDYLSSQTSAPVAETIPVVTPAESYVLSSQQQRLYAIHCFDPLSTAYNMPVILEITGKLEPEGVRQALQKLTERHASLRTYIDISQGEPRQKIVPTGEISLDLELREGSEEQVDTIIASLIKPFDLTMPPLFRVALIRITAEKYYIFIDCHHILSDGTSTNILIEDFAKFYAALPLPALVVDYKDYAEWQQGESGKAFMAKQKAYWTELFAGEIPKLNLPTDYKRPDILTFAGQRKSFTCDKDFTMALRSLAQKAETSLYPLLLSTLAILIAKYANQDDVVIGTPVSGRIKAELEPIIGMFVNTLAMRTKPQKEKLFRAFVSEMGQISTQAVENQAFPFEEVLAALEIKPARNRNPLFDVMFVFQNQKLRVAEVSDLTMKQYEFKSPVTKFDLTLEAIEYDEVFYFAFEYNTALFAENTITTMIEDYRTLLATVIAQPDIAIKDIELRKIEVISAEVGGSEDVEFNF
jgi:NAD(P)-dependent dehydrogenase (short-subunit alcohol dehydrogenase family)/acyl carrier protein